MGRLVNFGIGEIVDRLTILSLKLLYGEQAGKDTTHFRNERNVLLTKLHGADQYASWYELGLELHTVNSALWQAEDEMRMLRAVYPGLDGKRQEGVDITEPLIRTVRCGFHIQSLNDTRAKLISEINAKVGDAGAQEKLT